MPNYALLPSQPLRISLRTLRHNIGQPIHPTQLETFPRSTTHVLLITPTPCLTLFAAIVDPSLNLVDADNNAYHLPTHILPPSVHLPWAGAVHLAASEIWRHTGTAFQGLRISTLGALRPRGAGTAAPSTEVIRVLLSSAGAQISDSAPDIVLVPPGVSRRGAKIRKLLQHNVLCLGAGFVVDLLLRLRADPREYLVFTEQKHLCGPVIDEPVIRSGRPLPISNAVLQTSQERDLTSAGVRNTDLRRSKRIRQAQEPDGSEYDASVLDDPLPVSTTPQNDISSAVTADVDPVPTDSVNKPSQSNPSPAKHQRKRPRKMASSKTTLASEQVRQPVSSPASDEPAKSKRGSSMATPRLKSSPRATQKPQNQPGTELPNKSSCASSDKPTHQRPGSSRTAAQPKRPRRTTSRQTTKPHGEAQKQSSSSSSSEPTKPESKSSAGAPRPNRSPKEMKKQESRPGRELKGKSPSLSTEQLARPEHSPQPTKLTPKSSIAKPQSQGSPTDTLKQESKPGRVVNGKSLSVSTEEPRPKHLSSRTKPQPKRQRKMAPKETSGSNIHVQDQTSPHAAGNPKKPVPQTHDLISPTTPAQGPSKRPRIDNSATQETSPARNTRRRSRQPIQSYSNADSIPPRQLQFPPEDSNHDMSLRTAPFSRGPLSTTGSIISGRVDGHSFSVDEGFRFLFARLGEPSQADVDRLLRCIKKGGHVDDDDDENQREEQSEDNIMVADMQGAAHPSNPRGAESPLFEEEDETFPGFQNLQHTERTMDETIATLGEGDVAPSQRKLSRLDAAKREVVDAFRIPIPRQKNILSNVVRPEMAVIERANELDITEGHDLDDQRCQDSVDCLDWILGAENFVGVSRDAAQNPQQSLAIASCRRLWSSLFESEALQGFAAPNGFPDSDTRTLMGVCVRLLLSGLADDMKVMLSEKLLMVRDEQVRAGFDSLQTVLSSRCLNDVSFRDKALVAIWTTLMQGSTTNDDVTGAWEVLNGALIPRVDGILNLNKFKESKRPQYLEKELTAILQSALLTSYMFSMRLDFNIGDAADENDQEESRLHPENWSLVCHCMDKLCEVASSSEYRSVVLIMSTSFLRIVAINIGEKAWRVTDKAVASASKMVTNLSSLNGKNCFCVAPPMAVNQFRTLVDDSNSQRKLSESLKTICDYLFLLGWLYTVRGQGNPMKRAMTVIRSASSFTRGSESDTDASSRSINHHVGLLLTVADSLAGSAKDGEYLLCKMLTSKCSRPKTIAERLSIGVGEQDLCWRVTLQAISMRCKVLLARELSVHVYTDWLSQNLVETLCLLRRSSERRSVDLSEKEALRARDSIFGNLAILMISSLTEVNNSVLTRSQQDRTAGEKLIREAVEKPASQVPTCMRVAGDIMSQICSNPEESVSKNRHGLLRTLLSLVESQIVLIKNLLAPSVPRATCSVQQRSAVPMLDDGTLSFITDKTTENVILNVIGGRQLVGNEQSIGKTLRTAAVMLANLIELRSIRSDQDSYGHGDNHVAFLQRAGMDVTVRFEGGPHSSLSLKAVTPEVEDMCRLVFWSQAVRSSWILSFLQRRGSSHVMCISAILSLLACVTEDWNTEDRRATIRLGMDCASLEPLSYVFEPVRSDMRGLDLRDRPLARVEIVEKALRLVVKHWPIAQVHTLLKLLDCRLKHIIGSRSSIQPDAVILYSFTHAVSAQLGGFTHARFLHSCLSDIAQAVSRMTNSARDHSKTFHLVQSRVISALCMTTSDMETRVLVLRVANAFPASDILPGFWGAPLLPTDEVAESWTKRAEKHAQEWRAFVFTSVIEDPLFAGRNVACVVRRLAAANQGGDAMRRLVQGVLVRGRGKLDWLLRRDGRAWRDWSALCDELLES